MLRVCVLLHLFLIIVYGQLTSNFNLSDVDLAEETQHAICTIISNDIQTSANATVTRQLKGVCTTKQMEQKISTLEQKVLNELNAIKEHLGIVSIQQNTNVAKREDTNLTWEYEYYDDLATKSIDDHNDLLFRTNEILNLNATYQVVKGKKIYIYYWKVLSITSILGKQGIHIRSDDFNVLGHELCVQLYPQYESFNYLGLQLRPSSNFIKKHKFIILDHYNSSKDLISQTYGSSGAYNMIYSIPYEKLRERNYIFDDSIIVKIIIYLDS